MTTVKEILLCNFDNDYLQKKFRAYRLQTALVILLTAVMGASEWIVDHAIDPAAASGLIWMRLAYVWLLIPAWAIRRAPSHRSATLMALLTLLLAQIHDIAILRQLDGGLSTAVMSFVFYPLAVTLLCLGFSIFVNWLALALVTLSPFALAATGWLSELPNKLYGLIIWPTSIFLACICVTFAMGYHRRYLLERALEDASNTDALTGVANRRHFQHLLQRETSRLLRLAQPCALLMLDIDHFKRINDNFGHPTGDRVIKALADACTLNTRDVDEVARLGGEEFAVLMPGSTTEGAIHLAERIRQYIETMGFRDDLGHVIPWTVSIGVASLENSEQSMASIESLGEQLIGNADAALYAAKNAGRNCVKSL
ncbi:diguanylate cyclase [Pseudoduganella sp. FT93W]|uniref:diguanylate cyclase n=1 Tax=Duganella fentianensis TaxID=2692177 RepID=A0A845HUU6_9BURK|nr:GGDEF domain-containing protein [Duganella fentianensis]MYN44773.1 diguanylate cyclase [Duganella fentianensis]